MRCDRLDIERQIEGRMFDPAGLSLGHYGGEGLIHRVH